MTNDAELIQRCLDQDGRAWSEFIDRFSKVIYWAIRGRLTRHRYPYLDRDIDDIYQAVITSLWSGGKLKALRDRRIISTYLVVIASNAAVDFMRRQQKDITLRRALTEQTQEMPPVSVDDELRRGDVRDAVFEALQGLKDRDRLILELNYLHDMTHREIADMLKMPVDSVSTVIRRARERLRRSLQGKKGDIL